MELKSFKRTVYDLEGNGLLQDIIDFKTMPLKLNEQAKLWCIVLTNFENPSERVKLELDQCTRENLEICFKDTEEIIGHNIIKFDNYYLKLFGVLDYSIYSYMNSKGQNGEVFGRPVKFTDTLLLSKILWPDRPDGHSLDSWGRRTGVFKTEYRQACIDLGLISDKAPKGAEFKEYYSPMLDYCVDDTLATVATYQMLLKEKGTLKIDIALQMELKLADLTVKQEFYGFEFDSELAKKNLDFLNSALDERRTKVNPLLPPKRLNKGEASVYMPPKRQFKKNGDLSSDLLRFLSKIGATYDLEEELIEFEGKHYPLPLDPEVCLKEHVPADIEDLTHLKKFLINKGWRPSEWKERDLTKPSGKKIRLSDDKIKETIDRYVKETLTGIFKEERLKIIGVSEDELSDFLHGQLSEYAIRVPTSPEIKVGTAKVLCPNLKELGEEVDFVKDVLEYLTYRHRRNAIAGGELDDETGEHSSGFLSMVEANGRIRTPADTLGANCLTADTRLITDSGFKYITEINIGDSVLTHTGVYKPVIDTINNGIKPVFLVKLVNGLTVKCTENHPFWTESGWVKCKDLTSETLVYTYSDAEVWTESEEFPSYRFSSFGKIVNKDGHELRLDYAKESSDLGEIELLDKNNNKVKKSVSCFIYFAFNPVEDSSLDVLHLDRNVTNNNLSNLRLATSQDAPTYDFKASYSLSKVECIVSLPPEPTYDVTIKDDHSYVSNGIVTHNTGRYKHRGVANLPRPSSLFGLETRSMFKPGKGRIEFGLDWSAAEARVQGHYVYKYTGGPELAETLVADKPNSIHCLSSDTQILTAEGWKGYSEVTLDTLVAQWSPTYNEITFTKPTDHIVRNLEKEDFMVHITGDRVDILVTHKHRMVVHNNDLQAYVEVLAGNLQEYLQTNPNCYIPACANNNVDGDLDLIVDYYTNEIKNKFEMVIEKDNGYVVYSSDLSLIEEVQEELLVNNCVAIIHTKFKGNGEPIYQTLIPKKIGTLRGHYLRHCKIDHIYHGYNKIVWCVSVPSTYIVTKRNLKTAIVGNCVNSRKLGITRDMAKSFAYAILYGAGPPKLAKMLGVSLEEGKRLYDLYWESLPGMSQLKSAVEKHWEKTGRKSIVAIDGRPLLVRSKHSLLNLLFQSAGALLVKYVIVEVFRRLEELNLAGDPFVDAENAEKVFLMIVYHKLIVALQGDLY